ncbi:MAG: hypothetical protein PHQ52_05370 [Candidatus Omnitrophica bacterium]|nr:hypothetical protein [Candidatus Omnitrophota bacterium]
MKRFFVVLSTIAISSLIYICVIGETFFSVTKKIFSEKNYVGKETQFIVTIVTEKDLFVESIPFSDIFNEYGQVSVSRNTDNGISQKRTIFTVSFCPKIAGDNIIRGFEIVAKDVKGTVLKQKVNETTFFVKSMLDKDRKYELSKIAFSSGEGPSSRTIDAPIRLKIKEINTPFGIISITSVKRITLYCFVSFCCFVFIILLVWLIRTKANKIKKTPLEIFIEKMNAIENSLSNDNLRQSISSLSQPLVDILQHKYSLVMLRKDAYGCIDALNRSKEVSDEQKAKFISILGTINLLRFSDKKIEINEAKALILEIRSELLGSEKNDIQ